jgi:hypothetical protein
MMGARAMSYRGLRGASSQCRDLVIPLTISVFHWWHPASVAAYVAAATPKAQPIILASLKEAARDGWRPDEPTDFATLFSRSEVRTSDSFIRWRVFSVTIRLLRADSAAHAMPHG